MADLIHQSKEIRMLLNELAAMPKEKSDELLDKLWKYNLSHEALHDLLPLVARIPWHCGNPECSNEGCLAIQEARHVIQTVLQDIGM